MAIAVRKGLTLRLSAELADGLDARLERLRRVGLRVSRADLARTLIARALESPLGRDELADFGGWTESAAAHRLRGRRPTVLVVEDSDDTRELLEHALAAHGFCVFAASSVTSGLELLSRRAPVDLVVTDYALGDGNGLSMLDDARRRGWLKRTPVIVCTGHTELAVPSRVTLLHKPVAAEVLLQTMDALIGRSREILCSAAAR